MTDYEKVLTDYVKAVQTAQSEYRYHFDRVGELDKATQDVLHQIELGSPKERNKWATKLSHIRKERRVSKDMVALLGPLVQYATDNAKDIKTMERVLGEVRKEQRGMKDRKYLPKVMQGLTIDTFEGGVK